MKAIIGKKVGMSQIFDENGRVIPVTVIEAGPCAVVQKKTSEKEGYNAVQLGFEDIVYNYLHEVFGYDVICPFSYKRKGGDADD